MKKIGQNFENLWNLVTRVLKKKVIIINKNTNTAKSPLTFVYTKHKGQSIFYLLKPWTHASSTEI